MKTCIAGGLKRYLTALSIAVMALLISTDALADKLPEPTADFSADMHVKSDASEAIIKVQRAGEKQRIEMPGSPDGKQEAPIMILRKDKKLVWQLIKASKAYIEMPIDEKDLAKEKEQDFTLAKEKTETVNGIKATKYRISAKRPGGGEMQGNMWFTAENIMIKMDSVEKNAGKPDTHYTLELKNLKIGKIADSVFDLPADYHKMMGGPVGSGAGKPPAQNKNDDPLAK